MPRRPVIGIATQTLAAIVGERPHCWVMGRRYVEALRTAGALPWLIPLLPHDPDLMADLCDRLDGIFLTGGVDVDPSCYGEEKMPQCGATDPDRDAIELMLLGHALRVGKPVLAVCRGIQILNVALGGSLFQDVGAQIPGAMKHDYFPTPERPSRSYLAHDIRVETASILGRCLGESVVPVNSMHHQAIKKLAPGLVPTAVAPDGIIEAVEGSGSQFLVAVQWHPEELTESVPGMGSLFGEFVAAAA